MRLSAFPSTCEMKQDRIIEPAHLSEEGFQTRRLKRGALYLRGFGLHDVACL